MFSAVLALFSRGFLGSEGQKFLGVLGGIPWHLPKHQGKEDQGKVHRKFGLLGLFSEVFWGGVSVEAQRDTHKCSCSTPWSATGFQRSKPGWGATGPFGGGVAATPLRHTRNCGKNRDGGVATPWSAAGGGV